MRTLLFFVTIILMAAPQWGSAQDFSQAELVDMINNASNGVAVIDGYTAPEPVSQTKPHDYVRLEEMQEKGEYLECACTGELLLATEMQVFPIDRWADKAKSKEVIFAYLTPECKKWLTRDRQTREKDYLRAGKNDLVFTALGEYLLKRETSYRYVYTQEEGRQILIYRRGDKSMGVATIRGHKITPDHSAYWSINSIYEDMAAKGVMFLGSSSNVGHPNAEVKIESAPTGSTTAQSITSVTGTFRAEIQLNGQRFHCLITEGPLAGQTVVKSASFDEQNNFAINNNFRPTGNGQVTLMNGRATYVRLAN